MAVGMAHVGTTITAARDTTTASTTNLTVRLRTFAPPTNGSQRPRTTTIFHAGYKSNNRLLELPSLDVLGQDGQNRRGLDHRTALTVCGIIADNAWNGYFTKTRKGASIGLGEEPVLTETEYYFHVPRPSRRQREQRQAEQDQQEEGEPDDLDEQDKQADPYRYPIVPAFKHWRFPHDCLPPGWPTSSSEETGSAPTMQAASVSSASQAIRDRDGSCRLSGYGDHIERAHLCPRSEVEWFLHQDMDRYNNSRGLMGNNVIDDLSNSLALRVDIHQSFDTRSYVFVPKQDCWTAHFIADTRTLGAIYHNTIVDLDTAVHPCFLLARLAWAIFPMAANFLLRGDVRRVTIKQQQGTSSTYRTKNMTKLDLIPILNPPRARSQSPKKRDRPSDVDDNDDGEEGDPKNNDDMDTRPQKRISLDSRLPSQTFTISYEPLSSSRETPTHERRRLAALRRSAVLRQRPPSNRFEIMCCDYEAAERDSSAGLTGPKKWGGAHLCWECSGGNSAKDEDDGNSTPEYAVCTS